VEQIERNTAGKADKTELYAKSVLAITTWSLTIKIPNKFQVA
jgi:hypothetical protein